jgi:hypothetical protein
MMKLTTVFWQWWYRHHPKLSRYTKETALALAKEHGLESEVTTSMQHGCTPDEALQEWDIYPFNI